MPIANRRPSRVGPICASLVLATFLTACATDDPPRGHDAGPGGEHGHWRPPADGDDHQRGEGGPGGHDRMSSLFISPAGKPFRAGRDEPYPVAAWFAAANTAHDGRLTRAEFQADAEAFFRELDADHDGIIDGFELMTYEKVIAPEIRLGFEPNRAGDGRDRGAASGEASAGTGRGGGHGGGRGGGGGGGGGGPDGGGGGPGGGGHGAPDGGGKSSGHGGMVDHPQGAAWFNLTGEAEPVASADTSFNGRITLAQFLAATGRRFDVLDPTGRGYLVLDDLPRTAFQERFGEGRRRPHPEQPR